MAIYHLSVKTISRASGRSATASIAYRCGEKITCERTGLVHDYRRRQGVTDTQLYLPKSSPDWAKDRSALWNAAELAEKRKNSTVAREFIVALPSELTSTQRKALVRELSLELVKRHGMAVDAAIHAPDAAGDQRNHHAHLLCTTRRLTPEGFTEKTRELDVKYSGEVTHWRERWAELSNLHLERAGRQARIDHRTLEAQRESALARYDYERADQLERLPTIHLGPNVVKMERRGIKTDRGELSREIKTTNARLICLVSIRQRLAEDEKAVYETPNRLDKDDNEQDHGLWVAKEMMVEACRRLAMDRQALVEFASPEILEKAWRLEKEAQFKRVAKRAEVAQERAMAQMARHKVRLEAHNEQKVNISPGLLAKLKNRFFEQIIAKWEATKEALERRWDQLQRRVEFLGQYRHRSDGAYEMPTPGETLAYRKAVKLKPELSASVELAQQARRREQHQALLRQKSLRHSRHRGREFSR